MIDKEQVLALTQGGRNVFSHYLGFEVNLHKNFRSPFYEDKRASCHIYYDRKSSSYKFYDHGDASYSGDCFWFVATLKGMNLKLEFSQILQTIVQDLGLYAFFKDEPVAPDPVSKFSRPTHHSESRIAQERQEREERPYTMDVLPFNDDLLNYWAHYGIFEDTLRHFKVRSLKRYESISAEGKKFELKASPTEPIFAYPGIDYIKLYRPHSAKMRFLYGGRMPAIYCFGMEQIPTKGDMLFITGGEKDVLSLYAHGFNAICFNSETAQIPESIIESLRLRFRHIIILYDADETGMREARRQTEQLAEYKILNLTLPLCGSKTEKDVSDYFALGNGSKELKALLSKMFSDMYSQTMMMLRSCEIDYDNPPDASKSVVAVNGVPLGTQDNLFCITGGEGTGKSNYITAILAGTLGETILPAERTLGLDVTANPKRLAGIYNTCIICVLHFVPNGIKLCGHIGSELQRKAAGILSIEKDDDPEYSVVKALKVRDGSPLDVPIMLFGWDKQQDMHVYRGEKSKEDKERRKADELIAVVKEIFLHTSKLSYKNLSELLIQEMEIKDRTAKRYIAYMREQGILSQDTSGNYQKGERCRT